MTPSEYIKNKWGKRTQVDLAKELAKKSIYNGDLIGTENFESFKQLYKPYKQRINKWWKDPNRYPSSDILLPLSEVLGVSVESILRGVDIMHVDRPTSYTAAFSGDEGTIERLFANDEVCLDTKDEYAKSFVNYVIEFNNYQAFQIAINKGYNYPTKWGEYLKLYPAGSQVDFDLTKMIVEADDLEMFKKAFGRLYLDIESPHAVFGKNDDTNDDPYKIPIEIIVLILEKRGKILNWLMQIQPFTKEEWKNFNPNIISSNPQDNYVWEIPSMVCGISHLLNCAITQKSDSLELLLDRALEYVEQVKQLLGDRVSEIGISNYRLFFEFALCFKKDRRNVWAIVPYIENVSDISNDELRLKAERINNSFSYLNY